MLGSQAIAEILKREGVEQVFCFPYTPILDALAEAGIRPIVARQERVAENMADGFSRASLGRKIGVVTVQQGAGRRMRSPASRRPIPIPARSCFSLDIPDAT